MPGPVRPDQRARIDSQSSPEIRWLDLAGGYEPGRAWPARDRRSCSDGSGCVLGERGVAVSAVNAHGCHAIKIRESCCHFPQDLHRWLQSRPARGWLGRCRPRPRCGCARRRPRRTQDLRRSFRLRMARLRRSFVSAWQDPRRLPRHALGEIRSGRLCLRPARSKGRPQHANPTCVRQGLDRAWILRASMIVKDLWAGRSNPSRSF